MAESGLPPPLPPHTAVTVLMMSPALMPLATASLPHTARKVILPSRTQESTPTTPASLSRMKSPILRRRSASASGTVAVSTFRPPTSRAPMRKRPASPMASLALKFSTMWRRSFSSPMVCSAFSRRSPGLALKTEAAWNSSSWFWLMTLRETSPVVASMRRTPEATLPSLTMWNRPTLAVLSRWVPPQNSTE